MTTPPPPDDAPGAQSAATDARDARYMRLALERARLAHWRTHPNPMVGAVIVRDDQVLAMGHHRRAGEAHAEVEALRQVGMRAEGAELFVTLEPCDHFGRTAPCSQALVRAGIRRCVIGIVDPDPRVAGAGIRTLEAAGVECVVGVEQAACAALNEPFFTRVTRGRPFVTVKVATTLDGRIATRAGHSQWITGPAARAEVHRMRDLHDAVLVGTGTLLTDDPRLTTRLPEGEGEGAPSLRVVLDRTLRAPMTRQVFAPDAPTLLVTAAARADAARARLAAAGAARVDVLGVPEVDGRLELRAMMHALAQREVTTLLCEGGGELVASLLDADLVDRYVTFIAPRLVGGHGAPGPVGGQGVASMDDSRRLELLEHRRVGDDLRLDLRVRRPAPLS